MPQTLPLGDNSAFDLERFETAQTPVYANVCAELSSGMKQSHWMWFIFPQLAGLGRTTTVKFYGIDSRAEALAYWQHPVLAAPSGATARDLGTPDDLKLMSCMTLFAAVVPAEAVFREVLERFYEGEMASKARLRDKAGRSLRKEPQVELGGTVVRGVRPSSYTHTEVFCHPGSNPADDSDSRFV